MAKWMHRPAMRALLRRVRAPIRRVIAAPNIPAFDLTQNLRALEETGVILFSFGRSGTTVFTDFLASHPSIINYGEVLNEGAHYSIFKHMSRTASHGAITPSYMRAQFYPYLAGLAAKARPGRAVFDLKVEALHVIEGNWRIPSGHFELFTALRQTNVPVILLERRDLVARYVSGQIAAARGRYHSFDKAGLDDTTPFAIDIEAMDAQIALVASQLEAMKRYFSSHTRFLTLAYEDLFNAETGHFDAGLGAKTAALLNLPEAFNAAPHLEKMAPSDGASMITNWDDVEAARARHMRALKFHEA